MTRNPWNGNSGGVEGLKQKCPPCGGYGGMDIFGNYNNILTDLTFTLYMSNWNCKTGVFMTTIKKHFTIKNYLVL